MAMLERRCMFQTIIFGIYVRFRGVVFVKFSFMSSTFSCLPPTNFKRISRHPTEDLEKNHPTNTSLTTRRSRASFFWYFLSQTLRTRRECGKANLPVPFFAKCGLNMAVTLTCPNDLLSCEKPLEKKKNTVIDHSKDLSTFDLYRLYDFLRGWMWGINSRPP